MALPETYTGTRNGARFVASRIICDTAIEGTDTQWWDTQLFHPFTVVISGDFVLAPDAGVSLLVSNGVLAYDEHNRPIIGKPLTSDTTMPTLGPDLITAPMSILSDGPYRWVRIRIQGIVSGAIRAAWAGAVTVGEKG